MKCELILCGRDDTGRKCEKLKEIGTKCAKTGTKCSKYGTEWDK